MEYKQFILDIYTRRFQELETVLKDLTIEDLNYRPGPHSNSIGWLAWHTIRSLDRMNADFFGEDQLWVSRSWYVKFGREPDQKDTGMRHTLQQVAAFRAPDVQTYLDYYRAVSERTTEYINTRLSPADLDRAVASPTLGTTSTVEARLLNTINDFQHIGQAGYVKGMLKQFGWYGR